MALEKRFSELFAKEELITLCVDYKLQLEKATLYPVQILYSAVNFIDIIVTTDSLKYFISTKEFQELFCIIKHKIRLDTWPIREIKDKEKADVSIFMELFEEVSPESRSLSTSSGSPLTSSGSPLTSSSSPELSTLINQEATPNMSLPYSIALE